MMQFGARRSWTAMVRQAAIDHWGAPHPEWHRSQAELSIWTAPGDQGAGHWTASFCWGALHYWPARKV